MAAQLLFGNNIQPACKYCSKAIPGIDEKTFMCPKNGIVQPDYKCRHFYYDPLSRIPKPPVRLEKFDAAQFSLDVTE